MNQVRSAIGLKARSPFTIGLIMIAAVACNDGDDGDDGEGLSFEHGGLNRSYQFYKPQNLPPHSPLILVLHGWGGSSDSSYGLGFNPLADKHGFAVAYPQGTQSEGLNSWNAAIDDASVNGVDDVGFLSRLAEHLQTEHDLNPERTFVTGFSMGGYMSYTLACQASDLFKAAAPVAALMDTEVYKNCNPTTPIPIIHIHGTADWLVPIKGNPKDSSPGVVEIIDLWAKLNSCGAEETQTISQNTTAHYYRDGIGGNEVHYYETNGNDHLWPGQPAGKKGYEDHSGIDATAVIQAFFSKF